MKQTLKITWLLAVFMCLALPAWSKGTANVANTIHNLSTSHPIQYGNMYKSNVDEICVFCHTPHGGDLTGPLWNHGLPAANSFTHYNSATLSSYIKDTLSATRLVGDESLLCLSCHDGSVAINTLHNDPNSLNGNPILLNTFNPSVEVQGAFGPSSRIGASAADWFSGVGDLTDDHPISFSYDAVLTEYSGNGKAGQLHTVADALTDGVRFFDANNRVECSSCHDPHVDYVSIPAQAAYAPFLIMPNTGSALCLACHNK